MESYLRKSFHSRYFLLCVLPSHRLGENRLGSYPRGGGDTLRLINTALPQQEGLARSNPPLILNVALFSLWPTSCEYRPCVANYRLPEGLGLHPRFCRPSVGVPAVAFISASRRLTFCAGGATLFSCRLPYISAANMYVPPLFVLRTPHQMWGNYNNWMVAWR